MMKNKQRKKDRELCKEATTFVQFIARKCRYDRFTQNLVAGHGGLESWATVYLVEKIETTHNTAQAIAAYLIDKIHQETKTDRENVANWIDALNTNNEKA